MENMLIDFIWLNMQIKYLIQTILYPFKWDMALWKWPKCPSAWSEPGGKQWQHSIQNWHNSYMEMCLIEYVYNGHFMDLARSAFMGWIYPEPLHILNCCLTLLCKMLCISIHDFFIWKCIFHDWNTFCLYPAIDIVFSTSLKAPV